MPEVAVGLAVFMLLAELMRATKKQQASWMLLLLVFNLVFLHLWIVVEKVQGIAYVMDQRVLTSILISDFAFLLCGIGNSLLHGRAQNGGLQTVVIRSGTYFSVSVLAILTAIVIVFYFSRVGISLLAEDIEYARHSAKKGHGYELIFITHAMPIAALFYLLCAHAGKSKAIFWLSFIGMCFVQIATGFRAYLIMSLIMVAMLYSEINKKFSLRVFISIIGAGALIFSAITIRKLTSSEGADAVLEGLMASVTSRIIMEFPWAIEKVIQITDFNGYLYGQSYWWDLYSALPGPGESFGDKLIYWFNSRHELAGLAPITPSLIGEGYANFGYTGVFIGAYLAAYMTYKADHFKASKDIYLVSRAIIGFFLANSIMVGLGGMLASRFMPLVFFLLFLKLVSYLPAVSHYRALQK